LCGIVGLLSAFHRGSDEAEGLGGYLEFRGDWISSLLAAAEFQGWKNPEHTGYVKWVNDFAHTVWELPKETDWIGVRHGEPAQITGMLAAAPLSYVRLLMDLPISNCFIVTTALLPVRRKRTGQRRTIIPQPKADELEKALEYLIFFDAWSDHPLYHCAD